MKVVALIYGMDEAGRGPAIGPIVFGIVGATKAEISEMEAAGIDDSKSLTKKRREELATKIHEIVSYYDVRVVEASQIDAIRQTLTLNQLEIQEFHNLLQPRASDVEHLYLDAADVIAERFGSHFYDLVPKEQITSEHKGDAKYTVVGAASILAKTTRDDIIAEYRLKYQQKYPFMPMFTAGYPQDAKPFLRAYVKECGKLPTIARRSWKTCSTILEEHKRSQQSLNEFF